MPAPGHIPPVLSPHELAVLLAASPDIRLLDVRTPAEYETLHIRSAYNVPLDLLGEHGPEIRATVAEPVVLICQSGQRARKAEAALREAGMPNLHVLEGGIAGWTAAGQAVVRGTERISLERQVRIAAGTIAAIGGMLALAINPLFAILPAFVGSGLAFAGVTNTCAMAMVLARLPYNQSATCDVGAMVKALVAGSDPAGSPRAMDAGSPAPRNCAAC